MQSVICRLKRQLPVFKTIQRQFSQCLEDVLRLQNGRETVTAKPVSLFVRHFGKFNVKPENTWRGGHGMGGDKETQWRGITGLASLPSSKTLWDILKKEQIEGHDARHIHDIWMEYHLDPKKQRVATVIPASRYISFCETASVTPMFVLPVFRGPNAFETFVLQCQAPLVLFTSAEEYKRHGSHAAPHFVMTHYDELASSHGIVLVRGDIIQPHSLDSIQAMSLAENTHDFFTDRGSKRAFVHAFNKRPEVFDFKKMLDSLGHATDRLPH